MTRTLCTEACRAYVPQFHFKCLILYTLDRLAASTRQAPRHAPPPKVTL